MRTLLSIGFLALGLTGFSQGIQPGKIYEAGEQLVSPMYGIQSKVPAGWMGLLPMDTEIFLMVPTGSSSDGEIYVAADSSTFDAVKANWMEGLLLDNGSRIKSDGNIFMRGDAMASNIILEGNGAMGFKGYVEAKCGKFGTCITILLTSPPQFFEEQKKAVIEFSDNTQLVKPSKTNIYDDFDWKAFLSGKYLANFAYVPGAKSEDEFWLCPDGTFRSKLKRSGALKNEVKEYQGKKSGSWSTNSVGKTGTLTLDINKMGPVEIDLMIENDRVFLNGYRFFAMLTDDCK